MNEGITRTNDDTYVNLLDFEWYHIKFWYPNIKVYKFSMQRVNCSDIKNAKDMYVPVIQYSVS